MYEIISFFNEKMVYVICCYYNDLVFCMYVILFCYYDIVYVFCMLDLVYVVLLIYYFVCMI